MSQSSQLLTAIPERRPVIQTSFKSSSAAYPLLHIDALTKAIAASPNGQADPILYVPTDLGASACFHVEVGPGLRMLCPVTGDSTSSVCYSVTTRLTLDHCLCLQSSHFMCLSLCSSSVILSGTT